METPAFGLAFQIADEPRFSGVRCIWVF